VEELVDRDALVGIVEDDLADLALLGGLDERRLDPVDYLGGDRVGDGDELSRLGRVAGAAVIISMENYLAQLGAWVTIVQGIIFVVCVLTFRRGVIGEIAHFIKKPL